MDVIKLIFLEGDFLTLEDSIMDNLSLALYNDDIQQDVFSMHPFKALRVDRLFVFYFANINRKRLVLQFTL